MALEQLLSHTLHLFGGQKSAGYLERSNLMDSLTDVEYHSLKMTLQFVGCQAELKSSEICLCTKF